MFLIASYFLAWFVLTKIPDHFRKTASFKCIQAALWYMVISSIGPWALGGIMTTLGSTSIWYKLAIYFYLHFQYNAWFILALTGLLFQILERLGHAPQQREFRSFFITLNAAIILSLFLSVLWTEPPVVLYILGAAGAVLQVLAFYKLYKMLTKHRQALKAQFSPFTAFLFRTAGILLIGKIFLQLLTAIPYFAKLSMRYTDFVIGYLHWVFLGLISIALFAFLLHFKLLKLPKWLFWIYFAGFILSEALIFYKGTAIWLNLAFFSEYFFLLLMLSALLPISVGLLLIINSGKRKTGWG